MPDTFSDFNFLNIRYNFIGGFFFKLKANIYLNNQISMCYHDIGPIHCVSTFLKMVLNLLSL